MTLTVGSLFAGIGGFDLGLERAGMRSVWQSDIDPFCLRVLEKHWPDVLRVPDIRDVGAATVPRVDVICGGFPCQDISVAGDGAGLAGARSGLWFEYARAIRELRPRYVLVENVSALLARGLDVVLGTLAEIGYDAEWDCIPASAVGAPHRRDRIWLLAYANGDVLREQPGRQRGTDGQGQPLTGGDGATRPVAHADGERQLQGGVSDLGRWPGDGGAEGRDVGDSEGVRCRQGRARGSAATGAREREPERSFQDVADADNTGRLEQRRPVAAAPQLQAAECGDWWAAEPDVGRVANGVPARVDRLRALGNALVPQIAEWIGRRIVAWEEASP